MSKSKMQDLVRASLRKEFSGYRIDENYRPDWLTYRRGFPLELDFYIDELKAAIEVQGEQHLQYIEMFHGGPEGFEDQRERDKFKKQVCERRGILLLEVIREIDIRDVVWKIKCERFDVELAPDPPGALGLADLEQARASRKPAARVVRAARKNPMNAGGNWLVADKPGMGTCILSLNGTILFRMEQATGTMFFFDKRAKAEVPVNINDLLALKVPT